MGALSEHHRCPRGRMSRVTDALSTVGLGGAIGAFVCFTVIDRPAGALVIAAAALGAVLANALRQAVKP
jgi:hypothetical protein